MMSADIPLILFAKAPIAGRVKTRLTSHCSDQQAADIACLLMQASIEKACQAWPGKVVLSVALDSDHTFFNDMKAQYDITLVEQCAGHLGERMRHALDCQGYPAAVMGCDVPHISVDNLQMAYAKLLGGESVIGPAQDGGYYLLGLVESADELFENKPWGTAVVLQLTLDAANKSGQKLHHLDILSDIDEWQDLVDAANQVPSLQQYLSVNDLA